MNKTKIITLKKVFLIFISVFFIGLFSSSISAYSPYNDIELSYILEGNKFNIYRIGVLNDGIYMKTKDFKDYNIDIKNFDSLDKRILANTFDSYIKRDSIKPLKSSDTDSSKKLYFRDLDDGIYLINGESKKIGSVTYIPSPVIIYLGSTPLPGGVINLEMKYDISKDSPKKKDLIVYKIWKDDNNEDRPKNIEVELIKDGKIIDTVTLNEDNNWKKEWTNLSSSSVYNVTEKDVDYKYLVSIENEGNIFKISNTKGKLKDIEENNKYIDDDEYKDKQKDLDDDREIRTKEKDEKDNREIHEKKNKKIIPKTGQLWWPIPVLLIIGSMLILYSTKQKRKSSND